MKSAEYKELKILQEFYSEIEHALDNMPRDARLAAIEQLLDTVRTSLQQVSDDTPAGRALVASAAPAESTAELAHIMRRTDGSISVYQHVGHNHNVIADTLDTKRAIERAEKAEAAYHTSEQQFVTLAQVLGVPYELNTQQDLVAMVKARLQAADEVAKVVQTMLDLIESWTYTDSDDYPRISDDLGQVLDACIPLKVALTFYRKNQS